MHSTSTVTLERQHTRCEGVCLKKRGSCVFGVALRGVSLSSALSDRPASVDGAGTHLHALFFSSASVAVYVGADGVGDILSLTDAVVYFFLLTEPFVAFDLVDAGYAHVPGKSLTLCF